MKKCVLAGAVTLTLAFAGFTGINQASADDGVAPSLTARVVNAAQGDSSAYFAAKCPEYIARAVIEVGEWKTETINPKDQPSELRYTITSTRRQTPTSLTCFDYQDQSTNTTITVDLTEAVGPQVTVTGDGVVRKAAPGGNTTVGATGFTASQGLDVTFYSELYLLGKTTVAADSSAQLNTALSGGVTPGSSHYVVIKNDNEAGLTNVTIVNKDDLKKSGQPGDNGGRKNKPDLPHTGAAI